MNEALPDHIGAGQSDSVTAPDVFRVQFLKSNWLLLQSIEGKLVLGALR